MMGLLAWFGDTRFPDGTGDSPALSQAGWTAVYARLGAAAVHDPALVPSLALAQAQLGPFQPNGAVPIAVADFPVSIADSDAARQLAGRMCEEGCELDLSALATGARHTRAFAAAPLLRDQWQRAVPVHRGRTVTYSLDERFWFKPRDAALPDVIELDPGDGLGVRTIGIGDTVSATYTAGDTASGELRAHYADGSATRTARFSMPIGGPLAANLDDVWGLEARLDDGQAVHGNAWVYLGHGHSDVVNPVIVAEGFPGAYPPDYLYDVLNQNGFADTLRSRGYDLVLVGFANGLLEMQRNAHVVIACIEEAKRRTRAPLVAGGVSMGGLVARYALASMEHRGIDHRTRAYLSIDAPHLGAHTSPADQWFAHFFGRVSSQARDMAAALDSPANQQFLAQWVNENDVAESPLRRQFLSDLAAVGVWPKKLRKIAVSCGHGRGIAASSVSRANGQRMMFEWNGGPFAAARLYMAAPDGRRDVLAEGRCAVPAPAWKPELAFATAVTWEGAPGGTNVYNVGAQLIAGALGCGDSKVLMPTVDSVPTVSALALPQDARAPIPDATSHLSPFDDYTCTEDNMPHLTLTQSVVTWLLATIGSPASGGAAPAAPADPLSGFDPHALDFLQNPYPIYADFRRRARVSLVKPYQRYWVFRYDDVMTALHDTATFVKMPLKGGTHTIVDALDNLPSGLFQMNPPEHTRLRGVLEPILRDAFSRIAPSSAAIISDEVIAGIRAKGAARLELIGDYALPVPAQTLFAVFGLPQEHWSGLREIIEAIAAGHDITQPVGIQKLAGASAMALHGYLHGMLEKPDSAGLLGRLRDAAVLAGYTAEHVESCCVDFLIAGYLSTTFLIGSGIVRLLENPEQLAVLRRSPRLIDAAVAEMLRFDAPAQLVDRVVGKATVLGDVALPVGAPISLVLGSANHDDAVFTDPDTFVIERPTNQRILSFGDGVHRCIGEPLARLVGPIAIGKLVEAFPRMARDGIVQWQTDPYLRGPTSVPLAIA